MMAQDAPYPPQGNVNPRRRARDEYQPVELPTELPPMELWQEPVGLWMYARAAWIGGPAIEPNGVPPGIVLREDAMRVVNMLYPHAFPEVELQQVEAVDRPVVEGEATAYRA
jgi:hypothetical protein